MFNKHNLVDIVYVIHPRTPNKAEKLGHFFTMFSYGLDSANLIVNSNLLHDACTAICKTSTNQNSPISISIQASQLVPDGKIIAFVPSPTCTAQLLQEQGQDLLPITSNTGTFFDFIATEVNPSFSINNAAVRAFATLCDDDQLSALQDQIDISKPLLITGNALGGSIASLFTLWLLDTVYLKPFKRPICITFGSPLLGDNHFQKAIKERSSWPSCFLHVVVNQDPIPKLFISPNPASLATPTYKPFGSFLFCSESSCGCFDDPYSVFKLLIAMSSESVGNIDLTDFQINKYGLISDSLKKNTILKGTSELGDSALNPLQLGLTLQLEAIGLIKPQQQNNDTQTLIKEIEKRHEYDLISKKNVVDPLKKLKESKISMAYLEWFKKVNRGCYYGRYKKASLGEKKIKAENVFQKAKLARYWKEMVEKAEQMPQEERVAFCTHWLYAGTNYRRMVEPLDIADYYRSGRRDYIKLERSKHYKLMEKWFNDEKGPPSQPSNPNEREKASLTEDSCFWAHVEEAVISFGVLTNGEGSEENKELARQNLNKFEDYVIRLIRNCSVSPEIFLENSTFMEWWKDYKEYKEQIIGTPYDSLLAKFMRDECRRYI